MNEHIEELINAIALADDYATGGPLIAKALKLINDKNDGNVAPEAPAIAAEEQAAAPVVVDGAAEVTGELTPTPDQAPVVDIAGGNGPTPTPH